jgi:molybdopterin-guanine dinucleotide biosynthesis protein A
MANRDQLTTLPVFRLYGGEKKQRREFLEKLAVALDRSLLYGAIIDEDNPCRYALNLLARQHDLVLITGKTNLPVQKLIIGNPDDSSPGELHWNGGEDREMDFFLQRLAARLDEMVRSTHVWACILIGGKSSRMGRAKHLIGANNGDGRSWLEATVERLSPLVDNLVVSGDGQLPGSCAQLTRLPDIPGVAGPLSGILSATRWNPSVNWLLTACDMPKISTAAVSWLLDGRRAGCWGRVPRLADADFCEPLFALYDFRAGQLFEQQFLDGSLRIGDAAQHLKIDNPVIPESLGDCWGNINTPEQLARMADEKRDHY